MIADHVRALLAAALVLATVLALRAGEGSAWAESGGRGRGGADVRSAEVGADGSGPSPVIFPPERMAIEFDHAEHAGELRVPCAECHDLALRSVHARDRLLPSGQKCDRCHHTDHGDLGAVKRVRESALSECRACHIGYATEHGNRVARSALPAPNLVMNHAVHAARNIGCAQCHPAVERSRRAAERDLPDMRLCVRCHMMPGAARGSARGECITCHLSQQGRVKTEYASGRLVPPRWLANAEHDPGWLSRHARVAGADSELCASCHAERECAACHDGRVRDRRIHPNDWLSMHGVAAQQAPGDCRSCHRVQSFCVTCHTRSGVSQTGPYSSIEGRGRFHPPKAVWSDRPRTRSHHARAAQRNLVSCVSCHVERDCLVCHSSGARGGMGIGPGGSDVGRGAAPHGAGFRSRCRRLMRKNARPCLACHTPDDPDLASCR